MLVHSAIARGRKRRRRIGQLLPPRCFYCSYYHHRGGSLVSCFIVVVTVLQCFSYYDGQSLVVGRYRQRLLIQQQQLDVIYGHPAAASGTSAAKSANDRAAQLPNYGENAVRPSASSRVLFEPGSLKLNRSSAIAQCYVGPVGGDGPSNEDKNKKQRRVSCAWSETYGVLLWYIGKTGSSTQRQVMGEVFGSNSSGPCRQLLNKLEQQVQRKENGTAIRITKVVTARHPVDRFVSAVKEMFAREGVFANKELSVPSKYGLGMRKLLDGLDEGRRKRIEIGATRDDLLMKTKVFEAFVTDYDGEDAFDSHLGLQIPKMLRFERNRPVGMQRYDRVLESDNLTAELEDLARYVGAPAPPPLKRRDSSLVPSRVLDVDSFSNELYQKICKLVATDLCCLNYELPIQCRMGIPVGERVMCEWVREDGEDEAKYIKAVLV